MDNFDIKVDRIGGRGPINTTHLKAFQEHQSHCQSNINTITVPRKKSRVLLYEDVSVEVKPVNVYKKPEKFNLGMHHAMPKKGLFQESVCNVDLHSKVEQFQPDISSS